MARAEGREPRVVVGQRVRQLCNGPDPADDPGNVVEYGREPCRRVAEAQALKVEQLPWRKLEEARRVSKPLSLSLQVASHCCEATSTWASL